MDRSLALFGREAADEDAPWPSVAGCRRSVPAAAVHLERNQAAHDLSEEALPDPHHDVDVVDGEVDGKHHGRLIVRLAYPEVAVQVGLGPDREQPPALLEIKDV